MGMKLDMRKTGTVRKTKFSELTERSEVIRDERLLKGWLVKVFSNHTKSFSFVRYSN